MTANETGGADSQPAAVADEATQQRHRLGVGILRDEALGGGCQPKVGKFADHQHPGEHVDVDAELEASHPARKQDLRAEHQRGADHTDKEGGASDLLRDRIMAGVVAPRAGTRDKASERTARRTSRCFGTDQRHFATPHARTHASQTTAWAAQA